MFIERLRRCDVNGFFYIFIIYTKSDETEMDIIPKSISFSNADIWNSETILTYSLKKTQKMDWNAMVDSVAFKYFFIFFKSCILERTVPAFNSRWISRLRSSEILEKKTVAPTADMSSWHFQCLKPCEFERNNQSVSAFKMFY